MRKLRTRLKNQEGIAVISVLGALTIVAALSIAVTIGVSNSLSQSDRDRKVKRALAASEAGIREANYRLNVLQPTADLPCVTKDGSALALTGAPSAGAWCEPEAVDLGNGATATYQLSPYSYADGIVTRSIISTGTVDGVKRRLQVLTSANTGAPLFGPYALASDKDLGLSGNASIVGAARSNNDIDLSGNAAICGQGSAATPGPGHIVTITGGNATVCGSTTPSATLFALNSVDQGDAISNNDNGRFFGQDPKTGSVTWNAAKRELTLAGSGTLTLGGHTYSLCKLNISGTAQLIIAASAQARLYFDSTSDCGYASNVTQISVTGNGKMINTSQDPANFQIYLLGGNSTTPNQVSLTANSIVSQFTLHGPNTNVHISGNSASYAGTFVANQIDISGNGAAVSYSSSVLEIAQPTIGIYRTQRFVECRPTIENGAEPDSYC